MLALTLSLGPAGAQYAFAGPEKAAAVSSVHIDNFGRVDATYYRGAQPQGRDYADLAALGIKTVINLTSDDALAEEKGMVEQAGMKYLAIPMTTHVVPTAAQLADFFKVVNDPASQPVYVHCVGGRHRTGVMTAMSLRGYCRTLSARIDCKPAIRMTRLTTIARTGRFMKRSVNRIVSFPFSVLSVLLPSNF